MKYRVTLNGVAYEVEVEKDTATVTNEYPAVQYANAAPAPAAAPAPVAAPVPAAAPAAAAAPVTGGEVVPVPLPGKVVSVAVSAGTQVKAGDILVVIEAMKMENEVLAPRAGRVASVNVAVGQAVATGEAAVVLE